MATTAILGKVVIQGDKKAAYNYMNNLMIQTAIEAYQRDGTQARMPTMRSA